MKHSIGKSFAGIAGTPQEIFIVPNGYIAVVYMVFITNTSGSSGSYTMSWRHAHNNYADVIRFAYGKSLGSGESDNFSAGELIMKSLDKMTVTSANSVDVIVTFDLLKAPSLYTFAGE